MELAPSTDWAAIHQKDPELFNESETPDAKPEPEKAAFIEDLKAGRRLGHGLELQQELVCTL